jgi:hypothetical protein
MMRLWTNSYAKSAAALVAASAVVSAVVHTGVIAAWIWVTLPADGLPTNSVSNRVYYIPPPDRVVGNRPVREAVHYVDLAGRGAGSGDGERQTGDAPPVIGDERIGRAPTEPTPMATPTDTTAPAPGTQDSIFSVLDVDTAVTRSSNSAAPAYPLKLLAAHIMGYVNAQYVVDTTGFADVGTFTVLTSTNPEFIDAVRDALPYMRFKPAKIGPLKVRQLVQQQFSFKIDTTLAEPKKAKPDALPRRPG